MKIYLIGYAILCCLVAQVFNNEIGGKNAKGEDYWSEGEV